MHEFRRYVQEQMDARNWTQSDVANAGGFDRQVVYSIVHDTRDVLPSKPKAATVNGLAKAFGVSRETVLAHVAIAMGLPTELKRADVTDVSDDELIRELSRRLKGAGSAGRDTTDHPPTSQGTPGETNEGEKTLRLGDYRKEEPPPVPETAAAYHADSEGKRINKAYETLGEEPDPEPDYDDNQDPGEHE